MGKSRSCRRLRYQLHIFARCTLINDQQLDVGQLLLQSQKATFIARFHQLADQRGGGK